MFLEAEEVSTSQWEITRSVEIEKMPVLAGATELMWIHVRQIGYSIIKMKRFRKGDFMKKATLLVSVLCVLVFLLVGCAEGYQNPKSKELVIVNASESGINGIGLAGVIEGEGLKGYSPVIIPPGAEKSYYLPPYADSAYLSINTESGGDGSVTFTYDYKVDGRNETITATYTETLVTTDTGSYYDGNIELEGSNATEFDMR
jgi:hypothetical protein